MAMLRAGKKDRSVVRLLSALRDRNQDTISIGLRGRSFPVTGVRTPRVRGGEAVSVEGASIFTSVGEKYLFQKNKCLEERPVPSEASP